MSYSLQGADVRRWRENAGMTQDQAAAYLGIAREWLSKIENGKAPVSGNVTLKIQQHGREQYITSRNSSDLEAATEIREDGIFYGPPAILANQIRDTVEFSIRATGGDLARLGWLLEQSKTHLTPPERWREVKKPSKWAIRPAPPEQQNPPQPGERGSGQASA